MVERGADPAVATPRKVFLSAARALTTPLLPDDYIELLNPMWSTRELRGEIVGVRPETPDAKTIVIRPSAPWPGHKPGQFLRIGVEINGVRHWRAYSLTSDPDHPKGLLSITVKHVPSGRLSPYFTQRCDAGSMVYLGGVEGEFVLPDPLPEQALFISAGSGITPIMAMLRSLAKRSRLQDVRHIHSSRVGKEFIFGDMLKELSKRHDGYKLHSQLTKRNGRVAPKDLDELCPDWRDRDAFVSGPSDMLDELKEHWEEHGDPERLRMERFQPRIGGEDTVEAGAGGTVRFRVTDVEAECEGTMPILEGGEQAGAKLPFGCRMGICHTCVGKLCEGQVRDLRTGEIHGEEGQMIRTCINAPEGHVEIEL